MLALDSQAHVGPNQQPLLDKVALISGSSRGIGLAIAEEMARQGAIVVLSSRKESGLIAARDAIRKSGGRADHVVAHFGDSTQIGFAISAIVARYARIDILVNNVGINPVHVPIVDLDLELWSKMLNHNLTNYFTTSKFVARHMMDARAGKIINISSISGSRPFRNLGAYSVVKAGINMLTEVLALELGTFGVNVNGIAPGYIETDFHRDKPEPAALLPAIPIRRIGLPTDVAPLAAFLASDAARYITGQTILVDGGQARLGERHA